MSSSPFPTTDGKQKKLSAAEQCKCSMKHLITLWVYDKNLMIMIPGVQDGSCIVFIIDMHLFSR